MAQLYGGIVWEGNEFMDWGQAICREMYGPAWMNSNEYRTVNELEETDPVPDEVIERCKRWEAGEWPEWVTNTVLKR